MPWKYVGRFCLDLSRVELVERHVVDDGLSSVSVWLRNGKEVAFSGPDAEAFMRLWGDHTSVRAPGRGPPAPEVLTPILIYSDPGEAPSAGGAEG